MTTICHRSQLSVFEPTETAAEISRELDCPFLVASILEMRGISTEKIEKARTWLSPSLPNILASIYLGANASKIGSLWNSTVRLGNVVVYGDYDVDGIASTVLAMEICRKSGARQVRYFIPHRHEQGYGLHGDVLESIIRSGCNSLVVVDCGTKDVNLLSKVRNAGINVFVFDHHLVDEGYNAPPFVINPQIDGDSISKNLCAAAVLWVWALLYSNLSKEWLRSRLDLVALATVADCMMLNELNRSLVNSGLRNIRNSARPGLAELISKLDLSGTYLTEEHLAMKVIPCLNAAGRLALADPAVELLSGLEPLGRYADKLIELNGKRKRLSFIISRQVEEAMQKDRSLHVLFGENWPVGVLSGVASKVCNVQNRAVILAAPSKKGVRGTVRVPEGGDAITVLESVSGYLEEWGGHKFAAGFSVDAKYWDNIKVKLEDFLGRLDIPEFSVDAIKFNPAWLTPSIWGDLELLAPFGQGNPMPYFYQPYESDEKLVPLGKSGEHFKIVFGSYEILAFNSAEIFNLSAAGKPIGWVYHPRLDIWKGKPKLQLIMDYIVLSD